MRPGDFELQLQIEKDIEEAERCLEDFKFRSLEVAPGLEGLTHLERATRVWETLEPVGNNLRLQGSEQRKLVTPRQTVTTENGSNFLLDFLLVETTGNHRVVTARWAELDSDPGAYSNGDFSEERVRWSYGLLSDERALINVEWSLLAYSEASRDAFTRG
jgi:hypothetical protein